MYYMKQLLFYLTIITVFVAACSPRQKVEGGSLPYIDVKNKYPQKDIYLTDIAEVTYFVACSDDADFLYSGAIKYITENTIVINNKSSQQDGTIFFFSKDGTPKSRFNRSGRGSEEYSPNIRFVIYDEAADDVFLRDRNSHSPIRVYSSTGKYKRAISNLFQEPEIRLDEPVSFDDQSFVFFDYYKEWRRSMTHRGDWAADGYVAPFYRICKTDGAVLEHFEIPHSPIFIGGNRYEVPEKGVALRGVYNRIIKCAEGVRLAIPEVDTIFLYKPDGSRTPVMHQIPSVRSLNPMVFLDNYIDFGHYQCLEVATHYKDKETNFDQELFMQGGYRPDLIVLPREHYIRDKETGEIVRAKFLLPDYKGKELIFSFRYNCINEHLFLELDLSELKQAYRENKLSGKLKDLVATLDEVKDNNIFVILNLK